MLGACFAGTNQEGCAKVRSTSYVVWRVLVLLVLLPVAGRLHAQALDTNGFGALLRELHYETPLCPEQGPHAVIVYGKNAAWTEAAARQVQQAILEWSGKKLELLDDRTVTDEQTWLLNEARFKTPLIVLGNAQVNRVLHAMGTRYLVASSGFWPGGDRYLLRTVFEPFVADVNYVLLEASTEAGMQAAATRFGDLLKDFAGHGTATIPPTRVHGAVTNAWQHDPAWTTPGEYGDLNRSVTDIARMGGTEVPLEVSRGVNFVFPALAQAQGGYAMRLPPTEVTIPPDQLRGMAALLLRFCRSLGGRAHHPQDHYGANGTIGAIRALIQSGVMTDAEVNEFENCLVLSAAYPNQYWYDHIGDGALFMDPFGGRHYQALLLSTSLLLDYVKNHCRMDDRTRKEVERRWAGTHKTAANLVGFVRDNYDTYELGESTMMGYYSMLHQGLLENIRDGKLKLSADTYILTTDNIPRDYDSGCYAGLDSYIGSGTMLSGWHGRGILSAAAFYYDDPQYRWFNTQGKAFGYWTGRFSSVGAPMLFMHWDCSGPTALPERYFGVHALPYDRAMYDAISNPNLRERNKREGYPFLRPPLSPERAVDRAAFRDGFEPQDAYLFLATSQGPRTGYYQNNAIARYTDLGEIWLFHNTTGGQWSRNLLLISNGKPYEATASCSLEVSANLGEISAIACTDPGNSGMNWTRTVLHWRGHYFAVLDRAEALDDDEFNLVCRWRTPQMAELRDGVWVATAPSLGVMTIQNPDGLRQTSEWWEHDGSTRPHVLSQYRRAVLKKGEATSVQNLISVSGPDRPDEFTARRAGPAAMLVKGRTAAGEHLALIGVNGEIPCDVFQSDARIFDLAGHVVYLAGATFLRTAAGGQVREFLKADKPVNLLIDCASGQGEIEVTDSQPVNATVGLDSPVVAFAPGKTALKVAEAGELPEFADQLARLWEQSLPATAGETAVDSEATPFRKVACADRLDRPMQRLGGWAVHSNLNSPHPLADLTDGQYPSQLASYLPTWTTTENLECTIDLPQPSSLSHLRLVGVLDAKREGEMLNEPGDFTFSLVLSNDGFQDDNRLVTPKVTFEETVTWPLRYFGLVRRPTWRLAIGDTAQQIKLLPRAATSEKPQLSLAEIELYIDGPADRMAAQAVVGDVDGDGADELVVATEQHEIAVYTADGALLWKRTTDGVPMELLCTDLEEDGRAEVAVYDTSETLYRFNSDGSERSRANLRPAQMEIVAEKLDYQPDEGHILCMAAWAPDDPKKKEVGLWSSFWFRVEADGKVRWSPRRIGANTSGAKRVQNIFPDEPDVMATVHGFLELYASRRDNDGNYVRIGRRKLIGSQNCGPLVKGFAWVEPIDAGACRGLLVANGGGMNWFPAPSLPEGSQEEGWGFSTGGIRVLAALAQDVDGDGVPEAFLGRQDGFVNVLSLADGKPLALLNVGEPILGLVALKGRDGKPVLAVGTTFGVHLFDRDANALGVQAIECAAFAGPGGTERDRVFVIDPAGQVSVLTLK